MKQLETAYKQGYVYDGIYSPHRKRNHGNSPQGFASERFVVCIQNHDQVGNRFGGDRLSTLVNFEALKLAAGAMLLSPFVPMLFMGEEFGEEAPFMYFVSHTDPGLIEAVRKGRAEEFKSFGWDKEVPDPQGDAVFMQSKLNWDKIEQGKYGVLRSLYKRLIQLRQKTPALAKLEKNNLEAHSLEEEKILWVYRHTPENKVFYIMNFNHQAYSFSSPIPQGNWTKILDTSDLQWMGPGTETPEQLSPVESLKVNPWSLTLYQQ
jgi:maltooligosyltrehalose trehalohydrolase